MKNFPAICFAARRRITPRWFFVNSDVLWELFTDTGEPACWLAYRAVSCSGGGKEDAAAC